MGLGGRVVGDAELPVRIGLVPDAVDRRAQPRGVGVVNGEHDADQRADAPVARRHPHLLKPLGTGRLRGQPPLILGVQAQRVRRGGAVSKPPPGAAHRGARILGEPGHRVDGRPGEGPAPGARGGQAPDPRLRPDDQTHPRASPERVVLLQLLGRLHQCGVAVRELPGEPSDLPALSLGGELVETTLQLPDPLHLAEDDAVALLRLVAQPPALPLVLRRKPWPRIPNAAVPSGPGGEEGGIEGEVTAEPVSSEELRPVLGRAHVDVGVLAVVGRRGAEDDVVGHRADVGHGPIGVLLGKMLEDLDAGDQVIPALDRIQDAGHPAMGSDVLAHLRDGELRHVETAGIDSLVTERFDEETVCASDVEGGARRHVIADPTGHGGEEVHPVSAPLIGNLVPFGAVVGVVGGVEALRQGGLGRGGWGLLVGGGHRQLGPPGDPLRPRSGGRAALG